MLDTGTADQDSRTGDIAMTRQRLQSCYRVLPEAEKRRMSRIVLKYEPKMFECWMYQGGLKKGGHRPSVVAERKTAFYIQKLDEALFLKDNPMVECALRLFIVRAHGGLATDYMQLHHEVCKGGPWSDAGCLNAFPARKADVIPEVMALFLQMVRDGVLDTILCALGEPGNKEENQVDVIAGGEVTKAGALRSLVTAFRSASEECEVILVKLRSARELVEREAEKFGDWEQAGKKLREQITSDAKDCGLPCPEWTTLEELDKAVDQLTGHPDYDPVAEEGTEPNEEFWSDLASALSSLKLTHRSPKRQTGMEELCRSAVVRLTEQTAEAMEVPPLPPDGPTTCARAWLSWTCGLAGDELERVCEFLNQQGLKTLAELLPELDAATLIWQAEEDGLQGDTTIVESMEGTDTDGFACDPEADAPSTEAIEPALIPKTELAPLTEKMGEPPATKAEVVQTSQLVVAVEAQQQVTLVTPEPEGAAVDWSAEASLVAGAVAVLRSHEDQRSHALARQSWLCLREKQIEVAWWLAREAGSEGPSMNMLEMMALSFWSVEHSPAVSDRLGALAGADKRAADDAESLLAFAAYLLPSLLEPNSQSYDRLSRLGLHGWPALRDLSHIVTEFGGTHIALTPELLQATRGVTVLQGRRAKVREQLEAWWKQAPHVNIISLPALDVWRHWLGSGGWLNSMVKPILNEAGCDIAALNELVREHGTKDILAQLAERTYSHALKHRGTMIVPAREQIVRQALVAVTLASEWLRLDVAQPKRNDFRETKARELRQRVSTLLPHCFKELDEFQRLPASNDVRMQASAVSCRSALNGLSDLLDDPPVAQRMPLDPAQVLGQPLLRFLDVELDQNWMPRSIANESSIALAICRSLSTGDMSWREAFVRHKERGDYLAAARCIEAASLHGTLSDNERALLHDERAMGLVAQLSALDRIVTEARNALGEALRHGLYNESDYTNTQSVMSQVERDAAAGDEQFQVLRARVEGVQAEIKGRRAKRQNEVQQRLDALKEQGLVDGEKIARIAAVIGEDVITAVDYLERAERGEELPPVDEPIVEPFVRFFETSVDGQPSAFVRIARFLDSKPRLVDLFRNIREEREVAGLPLANVSKEQCEQAAGFLEKWFDVRQRGRITAEDAELLMTRLGFEGVKANVRPQDGRTWVHVQVEPVSSRLRCPLPSFGSEANGHYRILCLWNRPSEQEIIGWLDGATQGARLVFYFGSLTGRMIPEQPRRELARLALERRRRFLLLDDVLAMFLCAEPAPRLSAFIRCAAPFSYSEPYSSAAGLVPPEMFFGREWEMEQILNPSGSSFLFGGRQLGKTVLLRHAEKQFHRPRDGRVGRWIDLKERGIGSSQSPDKLWEVLGVELKALGVLPESFRPSARSAGCLDEAEHWIKADEHGTRRILLLLDEADDFLNADGGDAIQAFQRCSLIKGVMDRTDRRFKVVFAGLHNVQRSTRSANQPLAHFGEPICIGPMLRGAEAEAAANLVRMPLAATGYFFDRERQSQLVTRILAQTNYYPSLIQLFCQKLLQFCGQNGRMRFDSRTSPPWRLSLDHVKEAEKMETLRHAIRDKFILTLDLDKRFRLIAFLMAFYDGERAGQGFLVSEVARMARDWWPGGFANQKSDELFRDLLEEMVGLGVLRRDPQTGAFALRSPNLTALMGTPAELETELLSCTAWEAEPEYAPQHFHQTLNDSGFERSPFTAQQEKRLYGNHGNGVYLVAGSALAGLGLTFMPRLRLLAARESFQLIEITDRKRFTEALHSVVQRKDERLVLCVLESAAWSLEWMNEARAKLRALRSEQSFVSVLFAGGYALLKRQASDCALMVSKGECELLSLGPWHDSALRQWFERVHRGPQNEIDRLKVRAATGYWPALVEPFMKRLEEHDNWEATCAQCILDQQHDGDVRTGILSLAGLDPKNPPYVLKLLADLSGEASESIPLGDLAEYAETSISDAHSLLAPLEMLQLVTSTEHAVTIDPVVGRCLRGLAG